MYNVKIYPYPAGWQYRIYSEVIGSDEPAGLNAFQTVENSVEDLIWNKEDERWELQTFIPDQMWYNIFTDEFEHKPKLIRDRTEYEIERSKQVSMSRTINRVYHLARSNTWEWFFTLTFNPEKVDSFDYDAVAKKLSVWLMHCRRTCPDMKYLVVPEKHKSGRYHFHGLFKNCENLGFKPTKKYTKDGVLIYNVGQYRLGFSTATPVQDNAKVVKYISKYITKDLCDCSFRQKTLLGLPQSR